MSYAAVSAWCETLVWVLAHSLWQGAVAAGVVWVALRSLPARRANHRYSVAVLGLAAVVLSSLVTWSVLRLDRVPVDPIVVATVPHAQPTPERVDAPIDLSGASTAAPAGSGLIRAWAVLLAVVWCAGAGVMIARGVAGLMQAQTLAASGSLDNGVLEGILSELSGRLGLTRSVRLVVTERIRVPAALGILWPSVLVPAAMLSGTPVEHWRVILAHELAHIRRYDALVNLVQMVVESLLFFNPPVWWLSRQIRVEREACCDAVAAEACGRPLAVARTLVEVASSLRGAAPVPVPLLAMAGRGHEGELTDRVERLVDPDRAARPRASRLGVGAALLAIALAGVVAQRGTDLAVRAAADLMSARERVDRLAQLHAETNAEFLPPATRPPGGGDAPKNPDGATAETLRVTVAVRTEDGSPIPKGMNLSSTYVTGHASTGKTLDFTGAELPAYKKTYTFPPSRLRVGAFAPGFAAAASSVVNLFEGDAERTIELVLRRGATATLRVTDARNRGIPGAELRMNARMAVGNSASGSDLRTARADDQGVVTLERIGDGEYELDVRAPGFQRDQRIGPIPTDASVDWPLKSARPTPVEVVDGATGRPVPKARFEMTDWQRSSQASHYDDPRRRKEPGWLTFAESDADGRATLNDLRDGTTYTFGVLAEGYGIALVEDVQPGQSQREVRLLPPLTLAGRVTGALDRLEKSGRPGAEQRCVTYSTRLSNHLSDFGRAPVDADGKFAITGLVRGEHVTVMAAGATRDFVMSESRRDVELKAGPPAAAKSFPKRDVVIRLVGTAPGAPARGTLYVDWRHPDPECRETQNGPLPLRDDEVRMTIPVGAKLTFWPQHVAGYAIDRQDIREIIAGDGPQEIEASARPAGGIHGTIVRADGQPATSATVTAFATLLPPGVKDHQKLNPDVSAAASSFLLTLPLGGRYRVLAREQTETHNVWTVSDEIALDDSRPIAEVRLRLPTGRILPIRVLAPDGRPVADQSVHLELGFSLENGYSFSTILERRTGADGVAIFENLADEKSLAPLRLSLHVTVPPVHYRGWQAPIDRRSPVVVRLERGLTASGVLIEAKTGKPIPGAEVRLAAGDYGRTHFRGPIRTKTDARGEFRFDGLEDLQYTAYVDGAVPKGTTITPTAGGSRFEYPEGVRQLSVRAGAQGVRLEVLVYPGSPLRVGD